MKHSEAKELVPKILSAFQKFRSNLALDTPLGDDEVSARCFPWIFGDKNPIQFLTKMLDNDIIEPMEWYNLMTVFHKFIPEFSMGAPLLLGQELPEPDIKLVANGWEAE